MFLCSVIEPVPPPRPAFPVFTWGWGRQERRALCAAGPEPRAVRLLGRASMARTHLLTAPPPRDLLKQVEEG
jgi:hypothetical protein